MLTEALETYRKLNENDAFGVLSHPRVVANYLLHLAEARRRPLVMRSQPIGVEIELTNRCNLACIQCLRSRGLRPYALGQMNVETFERVLGEFPYVLNLSLNGFGEALMADGFFDVVKVARRHLPWAKIGIYSNGMKLDAATAERLPGSGLTEIDVSVDAGNADTFRRVRRGGELSVVHDGIRRLLDARRRAGARFPLVGMNFVMLNENEGELVPFIERAAELGADYVNCISYASYDWGFRNRRDTASYGRELAAARRRLDELGLRCRSFPSDDLTWASAQRTFDCSFFWGGSLRVTFAGEVTLGCCTPFKETYSYGNVLETPFRELWNGEAFRTNRRLAKRNEPPTEACRSCDRFARSFFAPRAEAVHLHVSD